MPNVIVDTIAEIRRVRALLPRLCDERRQEAERAIRFASEHMAMNSLEGMTEWLGELRGFQAGPKQNV